MRHSTVNLMKFKRLSRRLRLPLWQTVGLLESIWILAQHNARDGELGRFACDEIAAWIEWEGDELEMIEALVECGWLDREGNSLRIHDWLEECPTWIKGLISRDQAVTKSATTSTPTKSATTSAALSTHTTSATTIDPLLLNETKRNETKENKKKEKGSAAPPVFPGELDTEEFQAVWAIWVKHRKEIKKPLTPTQTKEQLKKFSEWGISRSVKAIEHTVANGWQGIREPDTNGKYGKVEQEPLPHISIRAAKTKEYLRK